MKKRYVVCLQNATSQQQTEILNYIRKNGFGWWHWINNTWLILDHSGKTTANGIRDDFNMLAPSVDKLVIDLGSGGNDTWSGFGPNTPEKNMFTWLLDNWKQ